MGGQDRPDGRGAESYARKRQYDYAAVRPCMLASAGLRFTYACRCVHKRPVAPLEQTSQATRHGAACSVATRA
jgi:hypothetical protein